MDYFLKLKAFLAEVKAIGGEFFMPPKLQGKVPMKDYVPEGSMKHLIQSDHFFQELVKLLTPPNVNLDVVLTYQFW